MPGLGHRGYLALAGETAWANGIPNALSWQYMQIVNETLKSHVIKNFPEGIRQARDLSRRMVPMGITADGALTWDVDVEDCLGILLKNTLPNETTTDNGAGNGGLHVFVPGDALLPAGLTSIVNRDTTADATNIWQYFGGRVKKLSFSAADGGLLKGTADLDFQKGTPGASGLTPSYTTQNPLVYHQGTITVAGASVNVKDFKVDIDTGLLVHRGILGSRFSNQQQPMVYKVSGEITAYFDNMNMVNDFLNAVDVQITLNFLSTALGTSTRRLQFDLPTVQFTGDPPTLAGMGEIMLKMPFTAYRSGNGAPDNLIAVSLLNSKRTAY